MKIRILRNVFHSGDTYARKGDVVSVPPGVAATAIASGHAVSVEDAPLVPARTSRKKRP